MGHWFKNNGPCVWCKATAEKVADRRAPPYCPEAPDELVTRELDRARLSANDATGY